MERDLPSGRGETGLKPDYLLRKEKDREEEEEKEERTKRPRESGGGGPGGSASPIFKVGTCAMPQMAWSWFRPKKGNKASNQDTRQFFLPMTYHLPYHSYISVPEARSTVYK